MESSNTTVSPPPSGSVSPASPTTPLPVVVSPCAACKVLRRRCTGKCVLAPYFPPNDPIKFTMAHRVFGASNIIKLLQELPECERADAVSSMVYEANARLRDPVYGSAGAIFQLQKQVSMLQEELAKAQAEAVNLQCQNANLMALYCHMAPSSLESPPPPSPPHQGAFSDLHGFRSNYGYICQDDDSSLGSFWDELKTLDMSV